MYQRANTTFDSVCHNGFYLVLVMYQQGWTQRSSLYVTTTFARYRVMYQRRADTTFTSVCHNGFFTSLDGSQRLFRVPYRHETTRHNSTNNRHNGTNNRHNGNNTRHNGSNTRDNGKQQTRRHAPPVPSLTTFLGTVCASAPCSTRFSQVDPASRPDHAAEAATTQ